jgi:hypothetical protein
MSPATRRAVRKYGRTLCEAAYRMHAIDGNGARTISYAYAPLNNSTNAADAAINAGRELVTGKREPQI